MLHVHCVIAIYLHQLAVNFEGRKLSWPHKPQRSRTSRGAKLPTLFPLHINSSPEQHRLSGYLLLVVPTTGTTSYRKQEGTEHRNLLEGKQAKSPLRALACLVVDYTKQSDWLLQMFRTQCLHPQGVNVPLRNICTHLDCMPCRPG
jgi:hypothetical protein